MLSEGEFRVSEGPVSGTRGWGQYPFLSLSVGEGSVDKEPWEHQALSLIPAPTACVPVLGRGGGTPDTKVQTERGALQVLLEPVTHHGSVRCTHLSCG